MFDLILVLLKFKRLYGPLTEEKATWFKNEMTCEHLEPKAFFKAPYVPGGDADAQQFAVRGLGLPWSQKYTDMTPGGWPSCSGDTVHFSILFQTNLCILMKCL